MTGFSSSDSSESEAGWTAFLATGFWTGEATFWTFLGWILGASSSDSSEEGSGAFFFWTTAFWTGDLALAATFLGASSSLSSSDDSFFAGFLATGTTFLAGATSTLACLVDFFSTTGVSYSSEDSCLAGTFLVTFFSSTFSFLVGLTAMTGTSLSESSSDAWIDKQLPQWP